MSDPHCPPQRRTPLWAGMNDAARNGRPALPRCRGCGALHYPPRELCPACLSGNLAWEAVPDGGTLLSWTRIHASNEAFFNEHAPWPVGLVQLDAGPTVIAHLDVAEPVHGGAVKLRLLRDRGGAAVLLATGVDGDAGRAGLMPLLQAGGATDDDSNSDAGDADGC